MRYYPAFMISALLLISYCGPKPTNSKEMHGITMAYITKTKFTMGNQYSKTIDDKPVRQKEVNPFYISSTEITNSQYAAFLNDGVQKNKIIIMEEKGSFLKTVLGNAGVYNNKPLAHWINSRGAENMQSWLILEGNTFGVVPGYENMPVVAVSWYGAYAFAENYGFRLPTEAEWECAARGGRNYLYGTKTGQTDIDGKLLNYDKKKNGTVNIGSSPQNPFGLYDMSGNVREWCLDKYSVNYYNTSPEKNPYNKLSPELPDDRVLRGGSFNSSGPECMSSSRDHSNPNLYDNQTGFRVVLSFYEL